MKQLFYLLSLLSFTSVHSQEEIKKDTTRINIGKVEVILVDHETDASEKMDTIDAAPAENEKRIFEAHWAGLDMGFTSLMNSSLDNTFAGYKYWENDPAKSMTWNLNLWEHKFSLYKEFIGITTGLGFSFTQIAFKDNYMLVATSDTLLGLIPMPTPETQDYKKNKLKATYLTVPLLLEFCTNEDADKSFYLAAGVVGGVRISSRYKRTMEDNKDIQKGTFALSSFKLDAAMRMGYGNWGAFATYALMPLFETSKTIEVFPLTFGLTMNF
jgi:hypothetical protein